MPEVENLNEGVRLVDSIEDQDGSVHQLANTIPSVHWASDVGKPLKEIDVVQNRLAKSLGCGWEMVPRIGQNFFEIR
jgi:hypothetical protein